MNTETYLPEGRRLHTAENQRLTADPTGLLAAAAEGIVLEGLAVRCDGEHNLFVELPCGEGVIPREEGAEGIAEGTTRDIALLARVGKPVCFTVRTVTACGGRAQAVLSRREAQERCRQEYLSTLTTGDILSARVTRLEPFGAFCDIGCGISALLPIAALSVSRIAHPSDRVAVGEDIFAVVSSIDGGRLCLSMRELLGTWEQNAARFAAGETVAGIVRSIESYGVFIELAPNLAGLAERQEGLAVGDYAGVYIKSILPDRMKIKLAIVDTAPPPKTPRPLPYTLTSGHISRWDYAPRGAAKQIFSEFS
ncbi:MAG: S1 RNA-binding domain-containing protein [Clostridia bacterium]|nr:S1 RNA-binding domain-containing protein [Clostridia bacterium]